MKTTRRTFLAQIPAAALAAQRRSETPRAEYRTFFGDLHNHNAVGYAQGSLERTFDIARSHLDFFAFTPHGHWHDIGRYEGNIQERWLRGFEVTRRRWPEVLEQARLTDAPGRFVPMVGYEWHSTRYGDYHVIFPDLAAEFEPPNDLKHLQASARRRGALLVPHHPANRLGQRGANFAFRDPQVSPVLEIYSEWGNAESDRGPYPYVRHTHGGRWTRNTLQSLLEQGHRVGVVASTDDHLGYPGAYREGLAAVRATELTRGAIFEALRRRRCYAVTGDRIVLDFSVNGREMGEELAYTADRRIRVAVTGWDQVDRIEVLKNNRVIHRDFPVDRTTSASSWSRPVLMRFEYGWGPWAALGMVRTADWDVRFDLEGGRLEALQPCFLPGPLEEERRDRIVDQTERGFRLQSFTALRQQIDDHSQKAVVLRARGGPDSRLRIAVRKPAEVSLTQNFRELAESSEMLYTGPYPKESAMVHRLVFADHSVSSFDLTDRDRGEKVSWYYVRVVQSNGQLAWSSPIWVEARK